MPTDDERYVTRRDHERDLEEIRREIERVEDRRKEEIAARWQRFEDLTGLKLDDKIGMDHFRLALAWAWEKVKAIQEAQSKTLSQRFSAGLIALGATAGAVVALWPLFKHAMEAILGAR